MTSPSPPRRRLIGIDSLRGLAALAVFVCHIVGYWTFMSLPGKLPQLAALGAHGVDIFIVISGLVLFLPVVYSSGRLDVKSFYGRRLFRILPAYYVALALAAILAMNARTAPLVVGDPARWPELMLHVLGVQTWFPGTLGTINGSLWSISLELHLYLVFPLLVLMWRRWGIVPVLVLSVALALAWDLSRHLDVSGALGFSLGGIHALPARLLQFTFGMWCATRIASGAVGKPAQWIAAALVAGLVSVGVSTAQVSIVVIHVAWGVLGVTLVMLVTSLMLTRSRVAITEGFGERSYSFYLLHQPGILLMGPLVALLPGWPVQVLIGGLLTFAVVAGAAYVMYATVERPTHQMGRRRFPTTTSRTRSSHEASQQSSAGSAG